MEKERGFRFVSFSFAVVSLQLHAFWQVGLMKSKAFPGACMLVSSLRYFFVAKDAVMFGVHCGRCLLLDSGANLCRCVIFNVFVGFSSFFLVLLCVRAFRRTGGGKVKLFHFLCFFSFCWL